MLKTRSFLFALVDRLTRGQKRALLFLIDFVLAPVALLISTVVVFNGLPSAAILADFVLLFPTLSLCAAIASVLLRMSSIKLNAYESREIIRTGVMAVCVTLAFALVVQFTHVFFPRPGIVLFGLLFFLLSVSARIAMLHTLLWILRAGRSRRRVLIYGAGNTGTQLAAALRAHNDILPVAFVDDSPGLRSMHVAGLRVYGSDQIAEVVANQEAERVLLAMPSVSAPKLAKIARRLQDMGLTVMTVPSFAQLVGVEQIVDSLTPVEPSKFLGRIQIGSPLPVGSFCRCGQVASFCSKSARLRFTRSNAKCVTPQKARRYRLSRFWALSRTAAWHARRSPNTRSKSSSTPPPTSMFRWSRRIRLPVLPTMFSVREPLAMRPMRPGCTNSS